LPALIFIVCHVPPHGRSILPEILSRYGPLLAEHAIDNDPFYPGHIYVAPQDRHLLIANGRMYVTDGSPENYLRPAINPLFRSAARAFKSRVIGVILSGSMTDGVAGRPARRGARGGAGVAEPRGARVAAPPPEGPESGRRRDLALA